MEMQSSKGGHGKGMVRTVEEMGLGEGGEKSRKAQIKMLKGDPIENICKYIKKFEDMARSRTERER